MNTKEEIEQWFGQAYSDSEVLLADGFEEAFLGVWCDNGRLKAVYDESKCISILENSGMDYTEAVEYFDFNVAGAGGEKMPIFVNTYKPV